MKKSVLSITPSVHKSTIAPEIYGQFSEHLGRCIYDGVYVGEDSDIPNTNGMRNDVVEALRDRSLHVTLQKLILTLPSYIPTILLPPAPYHFPD